jgi:lysozyme
MNRKPIFDAVRVMLGRGFTPNEVQELDQAITLAIGEAVRRISAKGLDLIKEFEGLRLQAYKCPADVPTIGYGSTGPHVRMGMTITEAEAEDLLVKDLARFEKVIDEIGGTTTQGQFDALVSLAFNVGAANVARSTLLTMHKAGDYEGAAKQFARWNRAAGRVLPGLTRRRAAEAKLYRGEA